MAKIIGMKIKFPALTGLVMDKDAVYRKQGNEIAEEIKKNLRAGKQADDRPLKSRKHESDNAPLNDHGSFIDSIKFVKSSVKNKNPRVEPRGKVFDQHGRTGRKLNNFGLGNWFAAEYTGWKRKTQDELFVEVIGERIKARETRGRKKTRFSKVVPANKSGANMGWYFVPSARIEILGAKAGEKELAKQSKKGLLKLVHRYIVKKF